MTTEVTSQFVKHGKGILGNCYVKSVVIFGLFIKFGTALVQLEVNLEQIMH